MARAGRFGRAPRSAPSLTNTLVAIAREFQRQRDQNIMDAWQKGGMFEGAKATDERVLSYWKSRIDGVSKDDPLHDTYKNAHLQLDYQIHESKMTAAYATGPKDAGADAKMVAFYLGWAKKVPKNSEFYRVLQRDAGQYMRKQRAGAVASTKQRDEDNYQRAQAATRQTKEAAGEYIVETLRRVAQSGNEPMTGISGIIGPPGTNSHLTDFDPDDPAQMLQLIRVITTEKTKTTEVAPGVAGSPTTTSGTGDFVANKGIIYHDDDDKPVTGVDIMRQLNKLDPNFKPGAPLDTNYVNDLINRQLKGIDERIARANKTGHVTDANRLSEDKKGLVMVKREIAAMPIQVLYTEARETYDSVRNDPTASPMAQLRASREYFATLTSLADDPRIRADDALRGRIMAEANGQDGVPSLSESFTGLQTGAYDETSVSDIKNIHGQIEFLTKQMDDVASGAAFWTYGETDSNGVFTPKAGGVEVGSAPVEAIEAGGANMKTVIVPDPRGGTPITMQVTATPVYAVAKDPVTGEVIPGMNTNPIGWAYDTVKGGQTVTSYGFQAKGPDGQMTEVFSSDPNWNSELKMTASSKNGRHLEVDFTPYLAAAYPKNPDGSYATNADGTSTLARDKDGNLTSLTGASIPGFVIQGSKPAGPRGGAAVLGSITFNPQDVAEFSGDRPNTFDPATDFTSLTLSNLMQDAEGLVILNNLDKNKVFKDQLDLDRDTYAGMVTDMKTGARVPGPNFSQERYDRADGTIRMAATATQFTDFVTKAAGTWSRLFTGSAFGTKDRPLPGVTPEQAAAGITKLATDVLQNTGFAALGNAFMSGTNNLKPLSDRTKDDLAIKPIGTLKVPGVGALGAQVALKPITTTTVTSGPVAAGTTQQSGAGTIPTNTNTPTKPTTPYGSPGGPGTSGYTDTQLKKML